jgi:hypothetical protein
MSDEKKTPAAPASPDPAKVIADALSAAGIKGEVSVSPGVHDDVYRVVVPK